MSTSDAQKSEVHATTDDASSAPHPSTRSAPPPSNFERGAADKDIEITAVEITRDDKNAPDEQNPHMQNPDTKNPDDDSDFGGPVILNDPDIRE